MRQSMGIEMEVDEKVTKFPKNYCWETNGQLAELVKQAEGALQYLEANSVGYYYYWMLEELKKIAKASSTQPEPSTSPTEQPVELPQGNLGLDPFVVVVQEAIDVMERMKSGRPWGERASWALRNLRQETQVYLKNKLQRQPEREAVTPPDNRYKTILILLQNLVHLKRHKDRHGKDDYYQAAQPLAWQRAMEVIDEINEQGWRGRETND